MQRHPENAYARYHAHVYFDAQSIDAARALCLQVATECNVPMGHVHERLIGPHPRWSYQLTFARDRFDDVVTRLDAGRGEMVVLIHGVTGDDHADHTAHAMWLGPAQALDLSRFTPREALKF